MKKMTLEHLQVKIMTTEKIEEFCLQIINAELEYSQFMSKASLLRIAKKSALKMSKLIQQELEEKLKNIYLPYDASKVIGEISKFEVAGADDDKPS